MSFGTILYYPGCYSKFFLPEIVENYRKIFDFLKVNYVYLDEISCCGAPAREAGYVSDFSSLIDKNVIAFSKKGINTIVTNCPTCAYTLKNNYPFEVIHVTEFLNAFLKKGFLKDSKHKDLKIAYHDSCNLGRKLGIYDEPRNILKAAGYEIIEFLSNKKDAICCGACGGLKENFPEIADASAKKLLYQADFLQADVLVTACPKCYKHFMDNSSDYRVYELSEVLVEELNKNSIEVKDDR